jgi:hypothetical protein
MLIAMGSEWLPDEIVSGGQTGVDRAALDVALELGIACGGWCPKGRRAEDGPIPSCYPLRETASPHYSVRTELNIRDSDGTLILNLGPLEGGTSYTARVADRHGRPCLIVALDQNPQPEEARNWLQVHAIRRLNVAGPREEKRPGAYAAAHEFLVRVLRPAGS